MIGLEIFLGLESQEVVNVQKHVYILVIQNLLFML